MKKVLFLLFMVGSVVALSSCKDNLNDIYDPNYEWPHTDFDFSTVTSTTLNVSYANTCMDNKVYFELYDRNPMVTSEDGGVPYLDTSLSPLYTGFTDAKGEFSEKINLPSYLSTVYVYSPYFYAQTIIKATCSNGLITANDQNWDTIATKAKTRAGSLSDKYLATTVDKTKYGDGLSDDGWLQKLGEYDQSNGRITGFYANSSSGQYKQTGVNYYELPCDKWRSVFYYYVNYQNIYVDKFYPTAACSGTDYASSPSKNYPYYLRYVLDGGKWINGYNYVYNNTGTDLSLTRTEAANLYAAQTQVINIKKDCPEDYRASRDMYIGEKDTEMAITYLGGNTCWNSSLGYYYYYGDNKPTNYDALKGRIILLFPNTQDGLYTVNGKSVNYRGVDRGTAVQLKFYGDDMKGAGTTKFPAGYRIGFVLATNTWSNHLTESGHGSNGFCNYRAATTMGASRKHDGNPFNNNVAQYGVTGEDPRRAAIYKSDNNVVVSFEDHIDDQNYSDVVFAVKSNKEISDVPVVKGSYTENIITNGVYAFEDLWPTSGDYDMNDVVLRSRNIRTLYTRIESGIVKNTSLVAETFELKTYQNYATLVNGIAFKIAKYASKDSVNVDSVIYSKKLPGETSFKEYDDVLMTTYWKNYSKQYANAYIFNKSTNAALPCDSVYLLTDNIANIKNKLGNLGILPDPIGTTYRVTLKYKRKANGDGIVATKYSTIKPFVTRVHNEEYDGNGGDYDYRLEIHIPNECPSLTSGMVDDGDWCWAKLWLWGHYQDASRPFRTDNGSQYFYYRQQTTLNGVESGQYPFAFFLAGAGITEEEITSMKLLKPANEGTNISNLYSDYAKWVNSGGNSYKEWYKEK